jgi:hypothetical protein
MSVGMLVLNYDAINVVHTQRDKPLLSLKRRLLSKHINSLGTSKKLGHGS